MFDMGYMLMVMLPGMVISGAASWMVKNTFKKYETVGTAKGMTGAEAAHLMRNIRPELFQYHSNCQQR